MRYLQYLAFAVMVGGGLYLLLSIAFDSAYAAKIAAATAPLALWTGRLITAYRTSVITRRMPMLDGGPTRAGALVDAQDLQLLAADPIRNDVSGPEHDQLAGTGNPPRPAEVGSVAKIGDAAADTLEHGARRVRIVAGDVEDDVAEIVARLRREDDPHSEAAFRPWASCSISAPVSAMTSSKAMSSPRAKEA